MKRILLLAALAVAAIAQPQSLVAPPKEAAVTKALPKEAALELENLEMRIKSAQEAVRKVADLVLAPLQAQENSVITTVCHDAGIDDVQRCVIDPEKRIVRQAEAKPPVVNSPNSK
jgi:hypothetical protein